ncbi:MAG: hypothetical protein ACI9Y1_001935 [Lentisphaeria bacterium]|jgi:hypothetical protein
MKIFIVIMFLAFSSSCYSINAWYWGDVTQIQTLSADGSFRVYSDNANIAETCSNKRVDFRVGDMGTERTKAALSLAMTAFVSGKEYGLVIDLPAAQGAICVASATATQGAGIR